jgi:hypothetical protein
MLGQSAENKQGKQVGFSLWFTDYALEGCLGIANRGARGCR